MTLLTLAPCPVLATALRIQRAIITRHAAGGVKARGGSSESTLEVKIRDGVADDGFERWSKEGVKASELARTLELAGHAQPEALRDRRVEVAKRRWQESVGGSAFSGVWAEQTDLRVTVGAAHCEQ